LLPKFKPIESFSCLIEKLNAMKYRIFGKTGLRVSELCLGTMTFGTEWGWGSDKEESKKVFDVFTNAGGNFLDTANRYTEGTSEKWLGEFVKSDRHHFVVASKYTLRDRSGDPNFAGNHRKNMMRSVEETLKRMDTEFLDIFWVHAWDFMTPVEEVLRGLDDLIRSGKVQYIGISDTPAWVVSQANTLAELRGWTAFAGLQIEYSLLQRGAERDLMPMAREFGLAVTPWGAIGGGALTGKYLKGETGRVPAHSARRSEKANAIAEAVIEIAKEMEVSPSQLAINWTRQHKDLTIIPLIGARTAAQLEDSLGVIDFTISKKMMEKLDKVSAIDLGFPHEFLSSDAVRDVVYGGVYDKIIK
jgi:aryl-alcohol dehydrogenase-like predicted oxidoreductase